MRSHLPRPFWFRCVLASALLAGALSADPTASPRTGGAAPDLRAPDRVSSAGVRTRSNALQADRSDRRAAAEFYRKVYVPYDAVPNGWTGSVDGCRVGANSAAYDEATLQNLRYYRAMAGVPADVSFSEQYNAPARAAALMMEAKNDLSHGPTSAWPCYSDAGKTGAGSSNLCLGCVGPTAIDAYVQDAGVQGVGHRVWALHPRQKTLGNGSSRRAHALYVFGDWRPEEAVAHIESVAWPASGYIPYRFGLDSGYPWSFQHFGEQVDHSMARVRLFDSSGRNISVRKENGHEHILVWYPAGLPRATHANDYNRPGEDVSIRVKIENILVNGSPESFEYTVMFFDPDAALPAEEATDEETEEADESGEETDVVAFDPELSLSLLQSAYYGRLDQTRDLLRRRANPDARYQGGWSALMYAAYFGHGEIVAALLEAGADPALQLEGWDAAGFAKYRGHTEIVRMLEARTEREAQMPQQRSLPWTPKPLPAPSPISHSLSPIGLTGAMRSAFSG